MREGLFQRFYITLYMYESEIVTFQKILTSNNSRIPMFYSFEGGRKDKTYFFNQKKFKFETHVINLFWLSPEMRHKKN